MRRTFGLFAVVLLLCFFSAPPAGGYSLLTHELLIDLTWEESIVPLLRSRYPTISAAQLEHARAYAYGGCVIQDIGYYPFGDGFFSDLTHYVRSGDFVINLFRHASNADELAFAIGALSHFIGDSVGHSEATNLAVPIEFPKLEKKYGKTVSYAQGESQHVRAEFAFDINQIAHRRMAPSHYLSHVGLEVPRRQLEQAFFDTYGVAEDFTKGRGHRVNVKGYRFAVRKFIPRVAYAVTLLHRHNEPPVVDSPELQRLTGEIASVAQKNNWDAYRKKAGIGTYSLAGLIWIMPKVGPIKFAAVKGPRVNTDRDYVHSVLQSVDLLEFTLRRFTPPKPETVTKTDGAADPPMPLPSDPLPAQVGSSSSEKKGEEKKEEKDPRHPLQNRDLDTGMVVRPSGYRLTDETYCQLAHRLASKPTQPIPPGIKEDILHYYADMSLPFATKTNPTAWKQLEADLTTLRSMPTTNEQLPFPTYGPEADESTPSSP
jgi:hypothetical protein